MRRHDNPAYWVLAVKEYLDILEQILSKGKLKRNRTGIDSIAISGAMFEHDMQDGFPLLTTKKMQFNLVSSELEFFIRGETDKRWLQERNNQIWDEWCTPMKVPYGHDEATKKQMVLEPDLGPIYGWQWRHFGAEYQGIGIDYTGQGIDQLANMIRRLKTDPDDRRMIVTAWNPNDLAKMALPPCHYEFQVTVIDGKLNLLWGQRSIDSARGLPFNIASYGLLLHLLAKESGYKAGTLTGFLADTHLYVNQLPGAREQLHRAPKKLPAISIQQYNGIFNWQYMHTVLEGYEPHPAIDFGEVAV
jgi:thymidylate synthase